MNPSIIKAIRYAAYRYNYTRAIKLNHKKPIDVSLELASHCNQRCVYCYHADQENLSFKRGFMTLKTAQLILTNAAELGVNAVKFNYRGEATLNPHFYEITKLAKDLANKSTFIDRVINSNFKFQNKWDIFQGLSHQTKIKVSIDSFRKDIMEKQRAGAYFEQTISNINTFYNQYLKKDSELVIQVVRTKLNQDEDFESEIKRRWPSATLSVRDMVSGRVKEDNTKDFEAKIRDIENRQSCIQAHARLIFDWQGNAQACCPDISSKFNFGNIEEKTISQIWNNPSAQLLRDQLKSKAAFALEPCKSCPSFESYKGYKAPWGS